MKTIFDDAKSLFFPRNELCTGSQGVTYGHTHNCSYASRMLRVKAKFFSLKSIISSHFSEELSKVLSILVWWGNDAMSIVGIFLEFDSWSFGEIEF